MRIGIQSWGSEGDLRPLVALGARLKQAGHEVRLVLSPVDGTDYTALCAALGLPLRIVPERMATSLREICGAAASADPSKVSRELLELTFFPYLEEMYQAALELCAGSDAVVAHFSSWYVKAAALRSNVPHVAVHFYPGMVPSREIAPPLMPSWRWLNRVSWALFERIIDLAFGKPASRFFASKGLPPVRNSITDVLLSDRLDLLAASPSLWPPPSDWGEQHQVCGAFTMPGGIERWEPSPELRAFLDAGEKPVLFSFGTLESLDPKRARELALGAARLAKVRAIVQAKSEGRTEEGRDGDLYFLPWAPHQAMLPCCSAMVHHGGAGTTHAPLAAGVPAVVVPFIFEQGLWGGLVERAGVAPKPLSFWKATPEKLAALIREVSGNEAMQSRARQLAEAVSREDGTGRAVELLERMLASQASEPRRSAL